MISTAWSPLDLHLENSNNESISRLFYFFESIIQDSTMFQQLVPTFLQSLVIVLLLGITARANQIVRLDFDSGVSGSILYTPTMRDTIQTIMEGHYANFDISFTQTDPRSGPFSTITFNSGSTGGLAQQIDFLNLDLNDSAVVNVDGLGLSTTADIVMSSAIVGSHELGHLLGLRHGDSYGPIGSGIHLPPGIGAYFPRYPGSTNANETTDHIMASPAAVGSSLFDLTTTSWLSERSAVKLAFAESPNIVAEIRGSKNSLGRAQPISLSTFAVPNTIISGFHSNHALTASAVAVTGALSLFGEKDLYRFSGSSGDLFNFEVMSDALDRIGAKIDPIIEILDVLGTPVDYFGTNARNDDEFETLDSAIIDLMLPSDGTYYASVSAFSAFDSGNYELFAYRFDAEITTVPESSSWFILVLSGLGIVIGTRFRTFSSLCGH